MPFGSIDQSENAVTPFRRTHVEFDLNEPVTVQQAVSFERVFEQMARGASSQRTNVILKEGIGWRIKSYFDVDWYAGERTSGQAGFLQVSAGTLAVAPGVEESKRHRSITGSEVPGIDTGASSDLATTAAPYYRRMWANGDDVSTLSLSTSSFNQPNATGRTYKMDRHFESVQQYGLERDFVFRIDLAGVRWSSTDGITTLYFPGPASETRGDTAGSYSTGRGEYALDLQGDGTAVLYERLTTGTPYTWKERFRLQWATPGAVFGHHHTIKISCTRTQVMGGGAGGTITFTMGHFAWNSPRKTAVDALAYIIEVNGKFNNQQSVVYKVPVASGTTPSSNQCQLRVDIRRDIRAAEVAIGVGKFFPTGQLICDKFNLSGDMIGASGPPLILDWFCDIPTSGEGGDGAAIDVKLYSAHTGAELPSPTVLGTHRKSYPIPAYSGGLTKTFYVVADFTAASSGNLSPTLISWKVQRDAWIQETGQTGVDFVTDSEAGDTLLTRVITGIETTGAERDITHETAVIRGADLLGTFDPLKIRSGIPITVSTEYDEADPSKRLYLFDGYVTPTDTIPIPGGGDTGMDNLKQLPNKDAYLFELQSAGKWKRLQELHFPVLQELWQDGANGSYKVTDMVKAFLAWAGFDSSQVEVDDDPIKLYGKGSDSFFGTEPLASVIDVCQSLLMDYLGWFLVWDRNLGDFGKWKAVKQVRGPNYTNVAAFITTGPPQTDTENRVVHNINSYPLANTLGDGFTYTDTAPTVFINKGSIRKRILPPEGNWLYVSTVSGGGSAGTDEYVTVTGWNPNSYNFDPENPTADPNNRDYLGRIVPLYYIVPSLQILGGKDTNRGAIKRLWRRIYDVSCHAIDMMDFEAPLLALDNESEVGKKRILRHYDPVTIDGVQYLIRNHNIRYQKDSVQMAMIQAERPNF